MTLDDRTIELTLPEREPNWFLLPKAVVSKGEGDEFRNRLRKKKNRLEVFSVDWSYNLLDGALLGRSSGGIAATIEVKDHTEIWVRDPNVTTQRSGYAFKGERPVELDYFKLIDFIQAVHSDTNPDPHWVETINGRRWVRQVHWVRDNYDMPPIYQEYFHTPLSRRRILTLKVDLAYSANHDIPDGMPGWMQRLSSNITTVLRSLKVSPPDDGSPDPFLIDPEQKAEVPPVEFPARRR